MKIGIIGFGSIGNRHYQNLKKYNFDIKILTKRKDISLKNIVSSWDDFSADADFDIIFVTNETAKHFETIKKCIKLKPKAIFIEKPLSHNIKGLND
ncbi:Gfo/Idh/MocA family oxidoreductase, partial [Candidatus Parcubacteria bacterium]|nr:Gfo/Idh/MocA family oxidoreductase [Candidatus Parcubacteria bacterium]